MTLNYIRIVGVLSEKGNYIPSHQLEAEKARIGINDKPFPYTDNQLVM